MIIEAIERHMGQQTSLEILDLGCGKGAVSIRIAEKLHCRCFGIDAIKEFIEEAKNKSLEYGVANLCTFEEADIRMKELGGQGHDGLSLRSVPAIPAQKKRRSAVTPSTLYSRF